VLAQFFYVRTWIVLTLKAPLTPNQQDDTIRYGRLTCAQKADGMASLI